MSASTSPALATNQVFSGGTPAVASFFGDGTAPVPPRESNSLRSSSNFGTDAEGSAGEKAAINCFTFSAMLSDFGTRPHDVSIPSKSVSVIGAPSRSLKYSLRAPRRGGLPTPWLLCMLRAAAAISVNDLPRSGLNPPALITARTAGTNGILRFWKKNGEVFQTIRVGFQVPK